MGGILDKLDEWLRGLLIEGITGNLSGMFDTVNTKVGEIAGEVGQTPLAWNSGVFSMIRNLSETEMCIRDRSSTVSTNTPANKIRYRITLSTNRNATCTQSLSLIHI